MRVCVTVLTIALLGLVSINTAAVSQIEIPQESSDTLYFMLIYDSLDLAFDVWTETDPPDTVKLDAYAVASGFLAGIPFHYERNRDRLTIFEQVDAASESLEFLGYTVLDSGYVQFNYNVGITQARYQDATSGDSIDGHGVSDLEALDEARDEARFIAFEEVIRYAMREHYTNRNRTIPGVQDGRVSWYEIIRDERDTESGSYIFDISAWVEFEED
jgi:hypothetical protein